MASTGPVTTESDRPHIGMPPGAPYRRIGWTLTMIGAAEAVIGVVLTVLRVIDPPSGAGVLITLHLIFVLAGLAMCGVGLGNLRASRVGGIWLTADGLVNREVRTRLIPWHGITGVHIKRRGGHWRAVVTLASGRRKFLVTPLTGGTDPDPVFMKQVEDIQSWWQHHRRAGQP